MKNTLKDILQKLVQESDSSNPAYKFLLNDYAKYHFVMVVLGGVTVVALTFFAGYQFRLLQMSGGLSSSLKTIVGKAYLYLGTLTAFLAFVFSLIAFGNLGNALNPRIGFQNSLEMLGAPIAGSKSALLQDSFTKWVRSESPSAPTDINKIVNDRLSWQMPKAIMSFLLLILLIYISRRVWAILVNNSHHLSRRRTFALFSLGVLLSLICTLLLVMTIANAQGSIAPMALSLFFS